MIRSARRATPSSGGLRRAADARTPGSAPALGLFQPGLAHVLPVGRGRREVARDARSATRPAVAGVRPGVVEPAALGPGRPPPVERRRRAADCDAAGSRGLRRDPHRAPGRGRTSLRARPRAARRSAAPRRGGTANARALRGPRPARSAPSPPRSIPAGSAGSGSLRSSDTVSRSSFSSRSQSVQLSRCAPIRERSSLARSRSRYSLRRARISECITARLLRILGSRTSAGARARRGEPGGCAT